MDKELIATVIIPKYIRKVQVSKERRASYYFKGEKLPTKYESKLAIDYQWIKFEDLTKPVLCNAKKELMIKNPDSVGLPKYKLINGQDLHTLRMKDYERSKIIKAIKEQMIPEIEKLDIIEVKPIRILCEIWDTVEDIEINSGNKLSWDLDNRIAIHNKVFQDVLSGSPMIDKKTKKVICTSKKIIDNDNIRYITQAPSPLFCPIEDSENRKLVYKIYHDKREMVTNNKFYGKSKD